MTLAPASDQAPGPEPFAAELALRAGEPLRAFNAAGVLAAADVHVARKLADLAGATDPQVVLAAALAVRAPRTGHLFADLSTIAQTALSELDDELGGELPLSWPAVEPWLAAVAASPLVASGEDAGAGQQVRPLRLVGSRLYLDRYWREERLVAERLRARGDAALRPVELELLHDGIARLFAGDREDHLQRVAAACVVLRRLAVIAGGPGTGKTTTAARALALLCEQSPAAGAPAPLVALCAPTGKAAARLEQVVHAEAGHPGVGPPVRERLLALRASTVHALLGWRPGSRVPARHGAANPLPHDVVIVDETSMVPLTQMARLLGALREDARLVLVGDPGQLAAIEAGAVLRDVVGPAATALRMRPATAATVARAVGEQVDSQPAESGFGDGIVVLDRLRRFGAGIAALARAVRDGDADAALTALAAGGEELTWIGSRSEAALAPLRAAAVAAARAVIDLAAQGDARAALDALGAFRLLCAHRHGPAGASTWNADVLRWLRPVLGASALDGSPYAGRPLLITRTDYELRLRNGDTGVIVRNEREGLRAVFDRDGGLVSLAPSRVPFAQTLYAMTIHKSQGSQFDLAAVVLGDASSRILTRELLYTAVTRARRSLFLVADEAAIRAAIARPAERASALGERLWGSG